MWFMQFVVMYTFSYELSTSQSHEETELRWVTRRLAKRVLFFNSHFSLALRIARESFAGPLPLPVEGVKLKLQRRRLPTITYPSFLLHFSSFSLNTFLLSSEQLNELCQLHTSSSTSLDTRSSYTSCTYVVNSNCKETHLT